MNELYIEDLRVCFGAKTVLQDVRLCARPGEILAILGENGSGKTTLLRTVQGVLTPKSGSVRLGETDLSALTVRERAALVTTVSQDNPRGDGISGMERIEMGLYPKKGVFSSVTEEERARIRQKAEQFGIAHLLPRPLDAMSTGERQLISLLRAAVQDTPVLLLDEPASALDFTHTEQLYTLMKTMAAQGKILLLVTHDPTAALRHAHRVFRMERGAKGSTLRELPDVHRSEPAVLEAHLRVLYPHIRVHADPLFCYNELEPRSFS
ncbi:MAG: ABC transporter ATP-binding protein [Clostridia bacterium]|nr:ABC transporter ATP-binding protein [Clostridia bacterium]